MISTNYYHDRTILAVDTALNTDGQFPRDSNDLFLLVYPKPGKPPLVVRVSARYTRPTVEEAVQVGLEAYTEAFDDHRPNFEVAIVSPAHREHGEAVQDSDTLYWSFRPYAGTWENMMDKFGVTA